jgi:hypothetical protein
MRRSLGLFGMAAVAAAVLAGSAMAQDKKKDSTPTPADIPFPKPGPEHEILKKQAGLWDATVEMRMEKDGKAEVTKGVENNSLLGDGLWLVQDFKGEMKCMPFQGHSLTGFDVAKKKYVGTWVDSMSPGLSAMEGTYDPKTKTLTSWTEGPCPTGEIVKSRMTQEFKDDNNRVMTMFSPQGQGDEFAMMKVTYKRRAATAK